ncbi:MAG: serine/threonine-protein kinase, partial [Kofleriaceae bacterium]
MTGSPEKFGGRFTFVRRIGEGGFGVVYEAIDSRFGGRVAIKVLRPERATAAARFKREFRSLIDVQHANLVRLFELAAHEETLFFSMELVEGVDFLEHVAATKARAVRTEDWPGAPRRGVAPTLSVERLRAALIQLAEALHALHEARKLHCDVKPTNVLVDASGRVVLLDFGLVANLDEPSPSTSGTPGYMAPEQASGGPMSEATDWYAVGAMLHEALTGELPRAGQTCETAVPELRMFADLCTDLLEANPSQRPRGEEVLARLGVGASRTARIGPPLFGRDEQLASLRRCWASVLRSAGTQLVHVVGTSGIGKTALVEHFLAEARRDGAWILSSRSYEQESVPYKALDGAIDALADVLRDCAIVTPPRAVLARVFPVLETLVRPDDPVSDFDSQVARRSAFEALRALFVEVSAVRPIVLFLDDVQWGDVDSARLLAELVRPPSSPRMFVIAASRPQETRHGFLAALAEEPLRIQEEHIELGELSPAAARDLVVHLV